jgi:peptidoglycan/LPS O-acetylase OafA/YrhL
MVVIHHSSRAWFSDRPFAGWGSGGDGLNNWVIQLPIIRLIISGYPQIAIFFVVSGFAISYKPMKLLNAGRAHEFLDSLAMSVFRRHMRLFLPAAGVMFCVAIITYMDYFGKGGGSHEPPHLPSLWEQLWNWGYCVFDLAEPFIQRDTIARYNPPYDINLWTLPVEFRNSVIVYTTMLGLSKTRPLIRLSASLGLILYCLFETHWDIFLFLSGMLLADLRFRRLATKETIHPSPACDCECQHHHSAHPKSNLPDWVQDPKIIRYFWTANFLLALFIVGMPEVGRGSATSPGFITLTSLIPQRYFDGHKPDLFWIPIAAVYLVFVIDNAPHLQRVFNCSFAQYLGKISFSLYMVHGPILYSFGWHVQQRTVAYTGQATQLQYGSGIALAVAVVFPVFFWVADLVWRLIDKRAVEFAGWVSEMVV